MTSNFIPTIMEIRLVDGAFEFAVHEYWRMRMLGVEIMLLDQTPAFWFEVET